VSVANLLFTILVLVRPRYLTYLSHLMFTKVWKTKYHIQYIHESLRLLRLLVYVKWNIVIIKLTWWLIEYEEPTERLDWRWLQNFILGKPRMQGVIIHHDGNIGKMRRILRILWCIYVSHRAGAAQGSAMGF
jgi:hypothetical protein